MVELPCLGSVNGHCTMANEVRIQQKLFPATHLGIVAICTISQSEEMHEIWRLILHRANYRTYQAMLMRKMDR